MTQVGRMEQHSSKFGQSRFVTAMQLKFRVLTVTGEKKKVASEVLRKYGVCVCVCVCVRSKMMFLTPSRHNSTDIEGEISCAYIGPKTVT